MNQMSSDAEKIIDEFIKLHVLLFVDAASMAWRERALEQRFKLRREAELLIHAGSHIVPLKEILRLLREGMEQSAEPPASPLFISDKVRAVATVRAMNASRKARKPGSGRKPSAAGPDTSPTSDIELMPLMTVADYHTLSRKAREGVPMNQGERLRNAAYTAVWRKLHGFSGSLNPADPRHLYRRPALQEVAFGVLAELFPDLAAKHRPHDNRRHA